MRRNWVLVLVLMVMVGIAVGADCFASVSADNINLGDDLCVTVSHSVSNMTCGWFCCNWHRLTITGPGGYDSNTSFQTPPGAHTFNSPGDFPTPATAGDYTVTFQFEVRCCWGFIMVDDDSIETTTFTVSAGTPPTITCPENIEQENDPGACSAVVTWTEPSATGDPSPTVTCDPASGSTFPVGTTPVTCTAENTLGTAECQFEVKVNDCEDPVVTCPTPEDSYKADAGCCYATLSFTATATDNCAVDTIEYAVDGTAIAYPYQFPVGTTTVDVTATDIHDNTATCSFDVTVVDNQDPVVTCPTPEDSYNADAGHCYATLSFTATATDNCDVDTIEYAVDGTAIAYPYQFPVGTTTVDVTATDIHDNTATCSFDVTVVDNQDPTITCPGDLPDVATDAGECYATGVDLGTPTTGDNCDVADVSHNAPAQFPKGDTTVTWTVTDTSGNTATCEQLVTVQDHEDPTITCPADLPDVATDAGVCYATGVDLGRPTTGDNCGVADVSHNAPAEFPKGDTTVTWTVTDTSGNTATCEQLVTVQDHEDPTIVCSGDITQDNDPGVCQAAVTVPAPAADDNCGVDSVVNDYNGTADASDVYPVGATTVLWTVTDVHGNTNTCTMTITVNDVEPPTTGFVRTPPDPSNDSTPLFTWAGTDSNGCTAPQDLEFSTNLDGAGWSDWSPATSATIGPLSEREHTFQVRGRDLAGNVESTASYTWSVDLTPPVITLVTPTDNAEYLFGSEVLADWSVRDRESGLASSISATCGRGEPIDTDNAGDHAFFVEATDVAGNVARVNVTYHVVYVLTAAGPAGGGGAVEGFDGATCFLDHCIAGGGGAVGTEPLAASYALGETLGIAVIVTDADDDLVVGAVGTVTLVEVTFVGDEEQYNIAGYFVIPYDDELGLYTVGIPTVTEEYRLTVGYYDVWIGFDDGTNVRHRIEITESAG